MYQKRGQVSIFLVALVIVTIAVLLVLTTSTGELPSITTDNERVLTVDDKSVRNFVQSCVASTAKNAVFYLGFVGGRLNPDPFSAYYAYDEFYTVPYFYSEGTNLIPVPYDEAFWGALLARYIDSNLAICIDDFKSFSGRSVKAGAAASRITFTDDSVIIQTNYPVSITRDFQEADLGASYTTTVNVRLRDILKTATTIVKEKVENDHYIHWDYLNQKGTENYNITAYTENENTIIYRIVDLDNKIDDEHYIFQFANKITVVE